MKCIEGLDVVQEMKDWKGRVSLHYSNKTDSTKYVVSSQGEAFARETTLKARKRSFCNIQFFNV